MPGCAQVAWGEMMGVRAQPGPRSATPPHLLFQTPPGAVMHVFVQPASVPSGLPVPHPVPQTWSPLRPALLAPHVPQALEGRLGAQAQPRCLLSGFGAVSIGSNCSFPPQPGGPPAGALQNEGDERQIDKAQKD